ncbi:hypothetical protein FA15DRAFT_674534 [Coprinopsis marcescibilis]|uniref:T6SS Phospholipase effector Tle1-like catalytic domain-containing protein n=1 Tax=Coprinopsis marcescibilis TaxID=230819 RepID=A0A5C3KH27_COPMA|nr:hypothetical protein FA15DRAFT_674534 [Coprinopsis marcescibilis]
MKSSNVSDLYDLILKDSQSNQLVWYDQDMDHQRKAQRRGSMLGQSGGVEHNRNSLLRNRSSFSSYYQSSVGRRHSQVIQQTKDKDSRGVPFPRNEETVNQAGNETVASTPSTDDEEDQTLLEAYCWLSENYQETDKIFLFGFAKGAYQVQRLSLMINQIGLVIKTESKDVMSNASAAYLKFCSERKKGLVAWLQTKIRWDSSEASFDPGLYRQVRAHFVGAWDTTSPESGPPVDASEGMVHVCHFRHALALDERVKKPQYAWGRFGVDPDIAFRQQAEEFSDIQEVWFAGTHLDLGGARKQKLGRDRSRAPLRWMVSEAMKTGLLISEDSYKRCAYNRLELTKSFWLWRLLKDAALPRRQIFPGQKIHSSFILAWNECRYTPRARPPKECRDIWTRLRQNGLVHPDEWLTVDAYEYAQIAMEVFANNSGEVVRPVFEKMMQLADGPQALYEAVLIAINGRHRLLSHKKHELLKEVIAILVPDNGASRLRRLQSRSKVSPGLTDLLTRDDYKEAAEDFLNKLTITKKE